MTVETSDGAIYDITDILMEGRIINQVTEGIGSFEVTFPHAGEEYLGVFVPTNIFRFYSDYASGTPTTLRFRGIVEKPSYMNNTIRLSGRSDGLFLLDRTVTKSFANADTADIFRALITAYGDGRFTTVNIPASTGVNLTVDWRQKPFGDCARDLCTASGYDWYVDETLDVNFFEKDSRENADEAMIHDQNLIEIGEFAPDASQVKNVVRVYGKNDNGVQVFYTAKDASSVATYGTKELLIQDDNISTYEAAQALGDFLLSDGLAPPIVGDVRGIMLSTIQPGQSIVLSAPYDGLYPVLYSINKFEHIFGGDGYWTTLTINKEPRRLSDVMRGRIEAENRSQDVGTNPFELDYSLSTTFDSPAEGTVSGTEIVDGVLKLIEGQGLGTWTTAARALSANLVQVSVNVDCEQKTGLTVDVSGNGGISYQNVPLNTLVAIGAASGTSLVLRLTLDEAATQVDGISLFYKLSS